LRLPGKGRLLLPQHLHKDFLYSVLSARMETTGPLCLACSSPLAPEHFLRSSRWSSWLYPPRAERALMPPFPTCGQGCGFLHPSTATGLLLARHYYVPSRHAALWSAAFPQLPPSPSSFICLLFSSPSRSHPAFLLLRPPPPSPSRASPIGCRGCAQGEPCDFLYNQSLHLERPPRVTRGEKHSPEHQPGHSSKLRDLQRCRSPRVCRTCPAARVVGRSRERERNRPQEHPKFMVTRKVT